MKLGFKVGEKLVYPNHGVTVVEQIGESAIMGAGDTYYHR
jgi:RNA polymerase-interacting CarD/CdnL/TRCF family regulator